MKSLSRKHVRTICQPVFLEDTMGGFGVFLFLLFLAFVLYMIIGAALQRVKGATGLEVGFLPFLDFKADLNAFLFQPEANL